MRPAYSFAYGSNTDAADWRDWCARHGHDPSALRPVGTGLMPDAQLRFDFFGKGRGGGVLNFQPRLGGYVEGVLLEVTEPAGARWIRRKACRKPISRACARSSPPQATPKPPSPIRCARNVAKISLYHQPSMWRLSAGALPRMAWIPRPFFDGLKE